MKTYIYIIILSSFLNAGLSPEPLPTKIDERKTDIYFGNGVWNDAGGAEEGRKALDRKVSRYIIGNSAQLSERYGEVKLQYNWGLGDVPDILETYYQLKEAGQINNLEFFLLLNKLTYNLPVVSQATTALLMASLPKIGEIEQNNIDEMLTKYYEESFKWSHRVLLVSHSQGNLFANRIYDSLSVSDKYKGYETYFTNVQVGSPASSIHAPGGKYITNHGDLVINPIPGSMSANSNPNPENQVSSECLSALLSFESIGIYNNCLNEKDNHKFVEFYLEQKDPFSQIIPAIRYQLEALKQRDTQWNPEEEGCTCKDKHVTVTHKFDDKADILMDGKKVKDFTSVGGGASIIYPLTLDGKEQYVKASFGGTNIEEISEDNSDLCYQLKNNEATMLGEIRGISVPNLTGQAGAMKMTLSWTYQCDIDMDLTMTGNDAVVYDIKDVEGEGKSIWLFLVCLTSSQVTIMSLMQMVNSYQTVQLQKRC